MGRVAIVRPTSADKPVVESVVDYGKPRPIHAVCRRARKHKGVGKAVVNYGRNRHNDVTALCVLCNVRLATWKEYPVDYVFDE